MQPVMHLFPQSNVLQDALNDAISFGTPGNAMFAQRQLNITVD